MRERGREVVRRIRNSCTQTRSSSLCSRVFHLVNYIFSVELCVHKRTEKMFKIIAFKNIFSIEVDGFLFRPGEGGRIVCCSVSCVQLVRTRAQVRHAIQLTKTTTTRSCYSFSTLTQPFSGSVFVSLLFFSPGLLCLLFRFVVDVSIFFLQYKSQGKHDEILPKKTTVCRKRLRLISEDTQRLHTVTYSGSIHLNVELVCSCR